MRTPRNITTPYTTATTFWNRLSSVNPRMALFMKVTPSLTTDLTTIGLTSNTRDMTLPGHSGVTFKSAAGMMPSNAMQSINEETTLELTGIYVDSLFKRSDVLGRKWENAAIEIFIAPWDDPNLGELVIFSGFLGEVKDFQTFFTAEGRGLTSRLSQDTGWITQRMCRVKQFRDYQCQHSASTVVIGGKTYDISYTNFGAERLLNEKEKRYAIYFPNAQFTTLGKEIPPDDYFVNGKLKCVSGLNSGLTREISASMTQSISGVDQQVIYLKRPFPFEIKKFVLPASRDQFDIQAGCNRTIEDCQKYSNIANFRGEPFVPGLTQLMRVPKDDEWTVETS